MKIEKYMEKFRQHIKGNRMGLYDCAYDVLDQLSEELANEVCENCKYSEITSATDSYTCAKGVDDNSNSSYEQIVNKHFSCNKFKEKK